MTQLKPVSIAVAALCVTLAASAAAPSAPPAPSPDAAKVSQEFSWAIATWHCEESWAKSPFAPAYQSTSTLTAKNEVNGVWLTWTYIQDPSAANPQPPRGADIWGYDPEKKLFIREKVDSFAPGKVTHLTSKGWTGDHFAFEGQAGTPAGMKPFKHTFRKVDEHTLEMGVFIDNHQVYSGKCTKE